MPQSGEPKKEKLKKATQRIDLDVDSSPEREPTPPANSRDAGRTPPPRSAPPPPTSHELLPENTMPSGHAAEGKHVPPDLDPSKQSGSRSESPVSPSTPTESTVQTPETISDSQTEPKTSTDTNATHEHQDSRTRGEQEHSGPEWDDVALRDYLDQTGRSDVKDLMHIVYDHTNVAPVPRDHPTMIDIGFHQTEKQLDDISSRLDGILNDFWAARSPNPKGRMTPTGRTTPTPTPTQLQTAPAGGVKNKPNLMAMAGFK